MVCKDISNVHQTNSTMEDKIQSTRRTHLKKLGIAGFLPIAGISKESTELVKIPELKNQEGVVKWLEVPRKWESQRRRVEEVRKNLEQELRHDPGVKEIGITAASETYSEKRGLQVEVTVDGGQLKSEIPDHVGDIRCRRVEAEGPNVPCCHNSSYSDLPGGVKVHDTQSPNNYGTSGWKVKFGTEMFVITAYHVIDDSSIQSGSVYGDFNNISFTGIGSRPDYQQKLDVALIDTDRSIPNTIQGESQSYDIGGWVTESGVSSRVADDFDGYTSMGCTTGETTGGLGKYKISDTYDPEFSTIDFGGHGVRGNADIAHGDSGGPAFSLHNGDAYLIYITTHGDPKAGTKSGSNNCQGISPFKKSLGTAAYHLNSDYQIQGSSHS